MALASGSRLNHFEVVALIGEGGMGEVYRAIDTKLHRPVALKVLPGAMATDPGRLDRFRIEARAVAALNHPHIVTIHSVEESDGVHFLAMELVDGCTLDAVLTDEGLDVEQFLSIAVPLTDALGAAHAMGITHRDLKPQNVMFGRDGRLKVLDFGLAKFGEIAAATGQPSAVTTTLRTEKGVVFGTVPYMSPEQIEGRAVDARSDVFSLGTMFYQLATGRRPFEGETPLALAAAILRDHPTPVAALRPALPSALNDIIERCLAKDPAARFQDGAALHQALRDASVPPRPAVVGPTVPEAGRPRSDRSPLVGRQAELGKLVEYLGETADGTGALVLVGGEAGVGKTRLAEELLGEARKRGIFTAAGYCHEAGSAPLSPFVEIIEQMLRELPARTLRVALAEDAPDIARLVPKVRRLWDDLIEPGVLDPEQQRRVLFNAVLEFFRRLSAHRPVLVLLDDLHWADEATIGLLQHLAPHLSQLPVMVLATYRDAEFDAGKPFEKGMATFVRQKRAFRVPVRCLSQAAVAEMLAAYGGSEPPATLVAA
ncbi:MAG: serine/threonine-protein kinase, partial [Acidobacteriota bacterium]